VNIVAHNTPGFDSMRQRLSYEEANKTSVYFFRWEDRTYSNWQSMPPTAVIGLLSDGQLLTYVNSLFLTEE
jgi:hypothetical protein